jgi:ATP-binding cassette subfamily F protein uup
MLPRGVDEYLERRRVGTSSTSSRDFLGVESVVSRRESAHSTPQKPPLDVEGPPTQPARARAGSAEERAARKTLARLDRQLERLAEREAELVAAISEHATDPERLTELGAELTALQEEKEAAELEWLEAAEVLE